MNSREKGARGEREFSTLCKYHGYDTRRGQQYSGIGGDDVVGIPYVHIETKRVERLNIEDAMIQSRRDAKGKIPIVAHRRNNERWKVTMDAEDWFKFLREWEMSLPVGLSEKDMLLYISRQ